MPGLVRGMARTAAVVGTATATRNAVNRRQANKNVAAYEQAYSQQAPQQQYSAPPQEVYAPAPEPSQDEVITQLERLGALHAQGILTDEEFAEQKAKLLGN
ncbi:MAG: SHOCT domain-containing protein [Caldilineales bacterium]|nr:SHOCT domain-containing protein [Caldilineales bacterium]